MKTLERMTLEEVRAFMQALKDRLARGEITREDFERARAPIRQRVERDGSIR